MELTHINNQGRAVMVNVSDKADTKRTAIAKGAIYMKDSTIKAISDDAIKKGDVLAVAQVAGIMGAKRTFEIIPMCHPLMLTGIDLQFHIKSDHIAIQSEVTTRGKTGVEMEALTAVQIAALTIYDMCKAIDKEMVIAQCYLADKKGGKSGHFIHSKEKNES